MAKTIKRTRRPSFPKGEKTPPIHQRKKNYRALCKARAADGMVNDAKTGIWTEARNTTPAVSNKSQEFSQEGSKHRGGSTRGGPRSHPEIYNSRVVDVG